jgi:uncharacterized protein YutE (UPF0331/DUF86 family)
MLEMDFKILHAQKEFKKRNTLRKSECYILVNLMATTHYNLRFVNIAEVGSINFNKKDSKNVLKHKFIDRNSPSERWFRGFVPEKRRVLGHVIFVAGISIPLSFLMFDKRYPKMNPTVYRDKHEAPISTYPKFDDLPDRKIESNVRNATKLAKETLKLTKNEYLLDKAIILSGEAVDSWFIPELSFFSAWRSVETIAKFQFMKEQKVQHISENIINDCWNRGWGIAREYIEILLQSNNISFNTSDLDTYQKLRNYIGHGSVDIDLERNMRLMEQQKFADIELSRKLIKSYL